MADILLTHSYFLRFDPKQWKAQKPYPPLAPLYAASLLKQHTIDHSFYDVMFDKSISGVLDSIKKQRPKIFVVYDDGFNYLTKMCLTNMRDAAFEMIKFAKSLDCIVVISSSDSTDHSEEYFKNGADYIIVGEAEQTLLELSNQLLNNKNKLSEIDGLKYVENGAIISTNKRENLKDLDVLPFPSWDLININNYKKRWLKSSGYFSLNLTTTRGCPYKCNWCAKPIYGNRYASRSPENVIEEIILLREKFQFEHIWFCDDIFGLKPGWIKKFSELIISNNLHIKFKIQSRADLLLEEKNIYSLSIAGCDEVWIGAESGSQKILNAMEKGITIEQIYQATNLLKENNIKPCLFLQFGYKGELKEDIDATIKMLFELMPHDIGISVSYPLPGTKFYEMVKEELISKSNWTDSDELAMLFKNSYPQGYYKKLQRHIHKTFRRNKIEETYHTHSFTLSDFKKLIRYPFYFFTSMPKAK